MPSIFFNFNASATSGFFPGTTAGLACGFVSVLVLASDVFESGFAFVEVKPFKSTFASIFAAGFSVLAGFATGLAGAAGFAEDFLTAAPFEAADLAGAFTGFDFTGFAGALAVFFACGFVVILRSSLDAAGKGGPCGSK